MKYDISGILDTQELQNLMDSFSEATGIPTAILDLNGNILTASEWQDICRQFHRKNNEAAKACLESDTHFNEQLHQDTPYVVYECPHGLIDAAAPIIVNNEHVANIFTGQFLLQERDENLKQKFLKQAEKYNFPSEEYMNALEKVPVFTEDKVKKILKFLVNLANFIGESGLTNLHLQQTTDNLEKTVQTIDVKYKRLVDASPDILYSFSKNAGGFFISNSVRDILQYDVEYLKENPFVWYNSIHPDDKHIVDSAIEDFSKGINFEIEYRIQDKSGKWHWFYDRSIGRTEIEGDPVIEGIVTDITERKHYTDVLTRERQNFYNLLDLLPAFVYLQDSLYAIRYGNKRFRKLFGENTIGKKCYKEIAGRSGPCDPCPTFRVFETKEPVEWEWNSDTGSVYQIYDYPFYDFNGELLVLEMGIDITKRKRNEKKLVQFSLDLERSNRELEHFAYIASHDLQEPVRKIINFTELFAKQYLSQEDEKADRYIHYIVDAAHRMGRLINDLLMYSRISRAEINRKKIDTNEVVRTVINDMEIVIKETETEISYKDLPEIQFDFTHFARIIQNLISNAIKFCPERKPVVRITALRQSDTWRFTVRDNGIGIDKKYEDRVFAVFQRLHTREISGTGIGLPVCRKIIERYGGRIWFESEKDRGTAFHFTVPD